MATKRGDKSKLELVGYQHKKEDEFLERIVLPTDTLQGIALLYNTTVAELKRLNLIHTDGDLHARRIIKVPSRGILVNLEAEVTTPLLTNGANCSEQEEEEPEQNVQEYLNSVDTVLKEIREKAELVAANSPILNGSESLPAYRIGQRKGELKWWKVLLPCVSILIMFPILYYFYREHLFDGSSKNESLQTENSQAP